MAWYAQNARDLPWRADREPYHVWLSEIMLQQTRASAVCPYYVRFLEALPTVEALAAVDDDRLMKLWEGLGYYSRARNLKKAAGVVVQNYGGVFPQRYDELLKLPGIGPYTAAAIASICFDEPTPAVDGNVLRVVARLLEIREAIDEPQTKKRITDMLAEVYPKDRPGVFTQSLMELGALVCEPAGAPACAICPLNALCGALKNGMTSAIPVRREKKAKREENVAVLLLSCDGMVAIRRRPNRGLLAGMWEFPNVRDMQGDSAQAAIDLAAAWGAEPVSVTKAIERTHIFTHVKWNMTGYYIDCNARPSAFVWASPKELSDVYALPTAFRQFWDMPLAEIV
jgi:A/G-specific adenine glycosylase